MNLASILRHWFTAAASIVTVWLIAALTLSTEDAHKLTEAFGLLVEPLIIIVGIVAVAAWRIFLTKAGSIFRTSAGEDNDHDSAGGLSPCVVGLCMAAGLMGFVLPSCSSDYPITGTLSYRDPHTGAKAGLSYSPRRKLRGGITVPIYDAQTGEQLGVTDVVIGDK